MSWRIKLDQNTVKVPREAIPELFDAGNGYWFAKENVLDDEQHLSFDYDAMEWLDVLDYTDAVVEVLKKYKVTGTIAFHSDEGDNEGEAWSHVFTNGNYRYRSGKLSVSWEDE